MAETREYIARWLGVWRQDTGAYTGGGTPIKTGGSVNYISLFGFYSELKEDINSSKIPVTVKLRIYATNGAQMDIHLHRSSANTSSSPVPAHDYTGLHPDFATGIFSETNITDFPAGHTLKLASGQMSTFVGAFNSGYEGIALTSTTPSDYGEAYGASRNGYEVKVLVTGEWNTPPGKPTVTYPNGGETISGSTTVTWNAATDAEEPQSKLRYQVAVYDGTWNYLPLTGAGVLSQEVDFSQFKESSVAKVAVHAFDSYIDYDHGNYGVYDYSDGVFTIKHNIGPTTPTNLSPANGVSIDISEIQRFTWVHNDSDAQSRYEIRWRVQGTSTWTTVTKDTTDQFHNFNGNTFPNDDIEWQVRTYDQSQQASPWSVLGVFFGANPSDRPEIISPVPNESISTSNPVVQWSSIDQESFDLEVWQGGTQVWDLERVSGNKAQTIDYNLSTGQTYEIRLRVKNFGGVWSDYASVTINTEFTSPSQANVELMIDEERGSISIDIENPSNSPIIAIHNNIYRRKVGEIDWLKIADKIPPNLYFTDFTPASGISYEYMVETWGVNGTFTNSMIVSAAIFLNDSQVAVVTNPDLWVSLKWNPSKKFDFTVTRAQMAFNNRVNPVSEFGQNEGYTISLSFALRSDEELDMIQNIIQSKQTLLFRDSRGRRVFCTSDSLSIEDGKGKERYNISFNPERVYFQEGIS
ncbi:hypothetical protein [Fictibacillus sp. NRS-1165]|uniref:hypothetical protein n=1 Tax=Fictibacillus sp. NRS-1165 TaxID=3144463 RepID=UPI003D224CED